MGISFSHFGHQRFCWMRVWHSAWSWLKLMVAAESVAGNTRTGMFTRLILRKPFQVGLAAMRPLSAGWRPPATLLHTFARRSLASQQETKEIRRIPTFKEKTSF